MPKKFFKRITPDHGKLRENRYLKFFGNLLHDPNLFHLNRRSASGAVANGLFWAMIPIPFQMIPAAFFAILLRVNLPISAALVWITNPITMPPVYYFCYKVGSWLMGNPAKPLKTEFNLEWLGTELAAIWQPFLLGCLVMAISCALLGYVSVRLLWRLQLIRHLQRKKRERELRKTFAGRDQGRSES